MCIVDLSKALMYGFHYDYIKNKYGNTLRLLFTETDSVMHKIETEVVYEGFSKDKEIFDFSNYSNKSSYYDGSNKLVVGKMTDETAGFGIKEFVGLKTKMYSFLIDDNSDHKSQRM